MRQSTAPLAGLRVVALEQAVAAPLCSRHLADLGADVIKIERPGSGDFARDYDDFVHGMASHFVWLNYRKRSVVLDLKADDGRRSLLQLLESADVFISNLGPGAVERIVATEELEKLNPRLITCQISGYGPAGPYKNRTAFDLLVQGEAGVTANTGTADAPAKPGVSLADLGGGIYATTAILAALHARETTGLGDHLHISMFDVLVEWMSPLLLAYREGGAEIEPAGTRHASITPYGPFTTVDDTIINVAVQNDRQWIRLCQVLDLTELAADTTLLTNARRLQQRARVEDAVAGAIATRTSTELAEALEREGIPWGRLNATRDVAQHPQLVDEGRWREVELPEGRRASVVAHPFRFARAELDHGHVHVPSLGEHTSEVLAEASTPDAD